MLNSENLGSPSHEHSVKQTSYGAKVLRPQKESPWLVGMMMFMASHLLSVQPPLLEKGVNCRNSCDGNAVAQFW